MTKNSQNEEGKFKDVKEMESSKNDQKSEKKKNAIFKTFDDEKVMKIEKPQKTKK